MCVFVKVNEQCLLLEGPAVVCHIKASVLGKNSNDFYATKNGKILADKDTVQDGTIQLSPRLLGGKGGFGSMLRAIGAQIEKTTNREACRDLSGRRLRDINEEKRLKNWIAQQAERERAAAERRKKKLERLCFEPRHDFSDQDYEKARTELTEKVHDAVEQGFRSAFSSTSTSGVKRKQEPAGASQTKKKKTCLWVDDIDEDDLSSGDSSDSECGDKKRLNEKGQKTNSARKLNQQISYCSSSSEDQSSEGGSVAAADCSADCSVASSAGDAESVNNGTHSTENPKE